MRRPNPAPRQPESGAIALVAAVVFLVVAGFMAFSLNVARKINGRVQLQAAFDAAALAGARSLRGRPPGGADSQSDAERAAAMADAWVKKYQLDGSAIVLNSSDIQTGNWNPLSKVFTPFGSSMTVDNRTITIGNATSQYINAVKINMTTDGSGGHIAGLDVWFNGFLGPTTKMKVGASAIAIHGGPCSNGDGCTVPLLIPRCGIVDNGGFVMCGDTVTLNFDQNGPNDAALTDLTQPSDTVTQGEESAQMAAAVNCGSPEVKANENVAVGLAGDLYASGAISSLNQMVCTNAAPGQQPSDGCRRYVFPVVDTGPCLENGNIGNNPTITPLGFVRGVITATSDPTNRSATPFVTIYIDCAAVSPDPGGCADFGYGSNTLRLVK